jgi:hypothetical protein
VLFLHPRGRALVAWYLLLSRRSRGAPSRWNILRDEGLSDDRFSAAPEICIGILSKEVGDVWREWHPLAWRVIKLRRLLATPSLPTNQHLRGGPSGLVRRLLS